MVMAGVALRTELVPWVRSHPPMLDCLEIAADQYYKQETLEQVHRLSARYPLMVRSSFLSLGTPGPPDRRLLDGLAQVVQAADPLWVSEHIAFRRTPELDLGHVCPLAPGPESIAILADHVGTLRATYGRPVILENIASDLAIEGRLSETEFLNRLCETAGCGLLLDLTSLFVNGRNHGFDPRSWMRDIEPRRVVQLHIAGYSRRDGRCDDSHDADIQDDIWILVEEALAHAPVRAVVIERDRNFPPVESLEGDLRRLKAMAQSAVPAPDPPPRQPEDVP